MKIFFCTTIITQCEMLDVPLGCIILCMIVARMSGEYKRLPFMDITFILHCSHSLNHKALAITVPSVMATLAHLSPFVV